MTTETAEGIGVALNEASWVTASVDEPAAEVVVGLDVLTLPTVGPMPQDRRRYLRLAGVSRVVASYRHGTWDDPHAGVLPLGPDDLDRVIADFGRLPIYGWEFVDRGDDGFRRWRRRLSFDVRCGGTGGHTLDLFQENGRVLDFRVWFDGLSIWDTGGQRLEVEDFIAGGKRWWDALFARDSRTAGVGIVPAGPDPTAR